MVLPCGSNTEGLRVTNTRAFMCVFIFPRGTSSRRTPYRGRAISRPGSRRHFLEYSLEDGVHVPKLGAEVERARDFLTRQPRRDVAVGQHERLEVAALVKGAHG